MPPAAAPSPRDNIYRLDKSRIGIDLFEKLPIFLDARGIPFVDLRPAFAAARTEMMVGNRTWDDLFLDYCHPNRAGQQLAAETIADALERNWSHMNPRRSLGAASRTD